MGVFGGKKMLFLIVFRKIIANSENKKCKLHLELRRHIGSGEKL
jgi:hypothetical protein